MRKLINPVYGNRLAGTEQLGNHGSVRCLVADQHGGDDVDLTAQTEVASKIPLNVEVVGLDACGQTT